MTRAEKIKAAMMQASNSIKEVESATKEWTLAHDRFNEIVTANTKKGRHSGTDMENIRLHAVGSYEALLDAMRVHSENIAHIEAIRGRS